MILCVRVFSRKNFAFPKVRERCGFLTFHPFICPLVEPQKSAKRSWYLNRPKTHYRTLEAESGGVCRARRGNPNAALSANILAESVSFGRFRGEIRRQLDRNPSARGRGNER